MSRLDGLSQWETPESTHQPMLSRSQATVLADAELLRPRMTNWGEMKETRWIIAVMIQHDLYHAGEINHIRSLRQEPDRWAYDASSSRSQALDHMRLPRN